MTEENMKKMVSKLEADEYLQNLAEALRVGNVLIVFVSLVKPSTSSHF